MRFHTIFKRQKGSASADPAIGSDSKPTLPPSASMSNLMQCKIRDIAGWPVQRICVGFQCSGVSPVAINADLYVWEKKSASWFRLNATSPVSVTPGVLTFIDVVAMIEPMSTGANVLAGNAASDSLDLVLVVADPGAAVNGIYTIGMGPDLTTVGT